MILIGSDHAGFRLKKEIVAHLRRRRKSVFDLGTYSEEPVDYPDIAKKVSQKVKSEKAKGILICGSGTGMCMAANRIKGIRAAVAYDLYSAKMARQDNDANIVCLRGRKFSRQKAKRIVDIFLATKFSNASRHKRRIARLDKL